MNEIHVIVVPEKKDFALDTTFSGEIYINKNTGIPKLTQRNARYAAPLWLDRNPQVADRIYHIRDTYETDDCTVLVLGNSFVLNQNWNNMGNHRKYEYHPLRNFGMTELQEGILI